MRGFCNRQPTPLMERNPLLFWKILAGVLLYPLTRH
jgi:hypothetical protein